MAQISLRDTHTDTELSDTTQTAPADVDPTEYQTFRGCMMLTALTLAGFGAMVLFMLLFGQPTS